MLNLMVSNKLVRKTADLKKKYLKIISEDQSTKKWEITKLVLGYRSQIINMLSSEDSIHTGPMFSDHEIMINKIIS